MSSVESRPQTFLIRPHTGQPKTWQLVYFAGAYRSTGLWEGNKLKSPEKQKVKELLWNSKMQLVEEDGRETIFVWGELTVTALNRLWQHGCRWEERLEVWWCCRFALLDSCLCWYESQSLSLCVHILSSCIIHVLWELWGSFSSMLTAAWGLYVWNGHCWFWFCLQVADFD